MTIPDALSCAREHHRAGLLAEAEKMYAEILALDPRDANALHLLGVIAGQTGRKDAAVEWIRKSVAVRPAHPEAHRNLGVAFKDVGRTDEAIASYRNAIALKPDYADAHRNLGNALHQMGRLDEAVAAYRQAIASRPDFAEAHSALGVALRESGQLDEAIAAGRRAIALKPDDPQAHNNLGNALHDSSAGDEAIAAYCTAIRLMPGFAQAHNNLGIALKTKSRTDEAIAAYQKAVAAKPDYADAHGNLAYALKEQGRVPEAIAAFRSAIALAPDSPGWRHVLAALCGDNSSSHTPADYVRKLFDPYAETFDEHLVSQLRYRVPMQLSEAIRAIAPGRQFDILDLGCGTGLCGEAFRPIAKMLAGVDLSRAMIAKADARGIYDRLMTADIAEALRESEDSFDLILAGDVFIYTGDLAGTFAAAGRALRGGGLFAFSLERHEGGDFTLNSKVRFAHSLSYVRRLAALHEFAELHVSDITVRMSGPDEVPGHIVVLQKPASGT